ncbi:MAG: hypothetical protein RL238_1123 [Actinomycetota bacterium]
MSPSADAPALRHVIVVGGTPAEWAAMTDEQWRDRLAELGKVADHVGASWLTLRPYGGSNEVHGDRTLQVGHCLVAAHPQADGRARIADAVASLQADGAEITEAGIAARLNAPAEADPDLVVVLGSGHRLPPSLVWELAYSELVLIDTEWSHLGAAHLGEAIESYARRHRRFGGID